MRITRRILMLFIVVSLLLGALLTVYIAQRQYQATFNKVVDDSLAAVLSRPDIQVDIFRRDETRLGAALADFMGNPAVLFSVVRDSGGQVLAQLTKDDVGEVRLPAFPALRKEASATDTVITALDSQGELAGTGFWVSATGATSKIHLTTPIFSSINPTKAGITTEDFIKSLVEHEVIESIVVMGYVHLVIDRAELLHSVWPELVPVLSIYFLLMLLMITALYLFLRRVTEPLARLNEVASEVSLGERTELVEIEGSEEFREVVQVFNNVIGGSNRYRNDLEVDRKLLNMRVTESASRLTQQEEELTKATEAISEAQGRIKKLAHYDALTNLPNRVLFTEQLRLLLPLSARGGRPLALLFLNLKNFKRINDSLGRKGGDLLLLEVGKRLTSCLRSSDMLGHYGGSDTRIDVARLGADEFSIVLNQLDRSESAGLVAQRVIDSLKEPINIESHELVVTLSIGIAIAPRDGSDVDDLLRAATTAMHHAREASKEGFLYYNQEMDAGGLDHIKLEAELRKAIERNQMVLHYQPQVDTVDGSIVGAEALLRWEHPEYGQVPPFRFIPIAAEIGLIEELGNWVLEEACRQLQAYRSEGLELPRIAINVTREQLGTGFADRIRKALLASNLPATSLELGLSEEILMDNDRDTIKVLRDLSELGVYLSVDNFGTSNAPLSYLTQYPLNELKIDRSFVSGCDGRPANANLIKAIIAMAHSLELRTVAEGVETEGELQFLVKNGARIIQGYLFSKPIPADELRRQLVVPWHYMGQLHRIELVRSGVG